MKYSIVQQPNTDLLDVLISGGFTLNEVIQVLQELLKTAYKEGKKFVFCDLTGANGELKPMERYEFAQSVASVYPALVQQYKYGLKIALYGNEPLVSPERLGEIVARNRFLNVKVFTDKEESMKWLLFGEMS